MHSFPAPHDAVGEHTGLLLERAVEPATPCLPDPPEDVLDAALRDAQAEAHGVGVTGIHEVESMRILAGFERLKASGGLRLRVLFHPPVAALPRLILEARRSAGRGIVLSMQSARLPHRHPSGGATLGQRGRGAYAFRSLLQHGAQLVFGSGVPVASLDPRVGIHAALERKGSGAPASGWHPEEKLGFVEALQGYTVASAAAAGAKIAAEQSHLVGLPTS